MQIEIEGKALETMPEYICIIAALVKRLGGEVQLTNKEISHTSFKGVLCYLTNKKEDIIIKVS
jgi:hypothetical protein